MEVLTGRDWEGKLGEINQEKGYETYTITNVRGFWLAS